ncbi:hypothetical protein UA41_13495 [Photobacterium kishitanii]|nr:hypothetical protein UA41_13495 [Photobacterium kishitanii]
MRFVVGLVIVVPYLIDRHKKKRPCVGVEVGIIGAVYLVIGSKRCFNLVDALPWPVMLSL